MKQKILNKVAEGLLNLNAAEHKRPKEPTKVDLDKKFVLKADRKGNLAMHEV